MARQMCLAEALPGHDTGRSSRQRSKGRQQTWRVPVRGDGLFDDQGNVSRQAVDPVLQLGAVRQVRGVRQVVGRVREQREGLLARRVVQHAHVEVDAAQRLQRLQGGLRLRGRVVLLPNPAARPATSSPESPAAQKSAGCSQLPQAMFEI